jgi:hypothetical protein
VGGSHALRAARESSSTVAFDSPWRPRREESRHVAKRCYDLVLQASFFFFFFFFFFLIFKSTLQLSFSSLLVHFLLITISSILNDL